MGHGPAILKYTSAAETARWSCLSKAEREDQVLKAVLESSQVYQGTCLCTHTHTHMLGLVSMLTL